MQIKNVRPLNFLYFRTRTKLNELGRFVGIIARELHRDAALYDQEVTGPVYWNYTDVTGNPDHDFGLEIALPVAEIPVVYGGKFDIKRSNAFPCLSLLHEGSWLDMPSVYKQLYEFAREQELEITGQNREIYVNVDFTDPEANLTEIQLGITHESYVRVSRIPVLDRAVSEQIL